MRSTRGLTPPTQTLEHVLGADPAVVRGFARAVHDALDEGPLSLMDRDRLIRRAERLGLKRFDANLIVAAMEQRGWDRPSMRLVDGAPERRASRWLPWVTAAAVQGAILAGLWVVCFG
jgi:hypothetical protein